LFYVRCRESYAFARRSLGPDLLFVVVGCGSWWFVWLWFFFGGFCCGGVGLGGVGLACVEDVLDETPKNPFPNAEISSFPAFGLTQLSGFLVVVWFVP